jgi:hypothetical protein
MIKEKIKDDKFITQHKRETKDFTRRKELTPADAILFVLGKTGNPMDFATLAFCDKMNKNIKASGMCKAREKLKFTAFAELLRCSAKSISVENHYKGYRLTSFDGIEGEMPRTPELMAKYQPSKETMYPKFHAVAEYDVLNCIYTNAVFAPVSVKERALVHKLFEEHEYEGKEIFLLDRGFPSVKVIQEMERRNKNYVMRVSKSFLWEVNNFGKTAAKDKMVHISIGARRKAVSRMNFEGSTYLFDLRCVKIDLPKGQTEILVTNLLRVSFRGWMLGIVQLSLAYSVGFFGFEVCGAC